MNKNYLILGLFLLMSIGFVSAYNGDFCNSTNTPCSLTGSATSVCTSTDLMDMYQNYNFVSDPSGVGDITGWNTSCITSMIRLFNGANTFNQNISNWDTSSVTTMFVMFSGATAFNQNIDSWNTSHVTDMSGMFGYATSFNQPLNSWDVSHVTDMSIMFYDDTAFNQNLSRWNISSVLAMNIMFNGVNLSIANYDALLNGWASQPVQSGIIFSGGSSMYSSAGKVGRDILINTYGWTITDGGLYTPPCNETWIQDLPDACDGLIPNFTISYSDSNNSGTTFCLPVDNGSVVSCFMNNASYIFEQLPFNSTGVISLTSDPVHNLLYVGSGNFLLPFGVFNLSNNVFTDLSSTDFFNWWGNAPVVSIYYDSVYDLVYTGGNGKFGVYNRTSNVWSDLRTADTLLITGAPANNWAGTNQVTSIDGNSVNGLIYTGLTGGLFGVYNLSNNIWSSLSLQDTGNWAGTNPINSLAVDSARNLVYTGLANGKFGVYNASSLAWLDLSSTDAGNWIGTQTITSVAFDSNHNLVYFSTSNGLLGVYNPVTNLSINLNISSIALPNGRISYDSVNDLVYTISLNGRGVYNPSLNVWSPIKDINRWMNILSIPSITVVNGYVYVGTAGSTSADGQLGKLVSVSCIENWLPQDSVCNGFTYVVGYYDSNSCGSFNYVPVNNGSTQRCNFNYVLDTWYDLSMTDKIPEYNWLSTGNAYPIGLFNGSLYLTASLPSGQNLSKYNPVTNIFSIVTNISVGNVGANPLLVGDVIYTSALPNFGVYNLSSNVFTDLSSSDPSNWAGTYSIPSFAKVNNLIFTRMSAPAGFFGVYNISDGVWYNSSIISSAMTRGFTNGNNVMLGDSVNNLLYIGLSRYPTTPPNIGALGVYNVSNNSLDIYTFYNSSISASSITDMVIVGDTLYLGYGSISGIALVSFNTSSKTFTLFSTADVGDWVNTSAITVHGLAYDSVNNVIYTSLGNKFGVFNVSSGVWFNHSILGNASVGDVLPTQINYLVFDSVHEVLYAGDIGGFHVYKTPYAGVPSCTPNWSQNSPMSCNGVLSNFTISYSDLNVCNVSTNLPVNNASIVSCCVENFVQNNTPCDGFHFVAGYIDLNLCNTTFTLPSDNGLSLPCVREARTSGGTGGNSQEILVPQSFFSNESSVPSNMITEKFFLVRWWDMFVAWINGWWYG